MTRPIEITDATAFEGGNSTSHPVHVPPKFKRAHKRNPSENDTNTTRQQLFEPSPDIPAAITEPP